MMMIRYIVAIFICGVWRKKVILQLQNRNINLQKITVLEFISKHYLIHFNLFRNLSN